jgi:hypothetical protein
LGSRGAPGFLGPKGFLGFVGIFNVDQFNDLLKKKHGKKRIYTYKSTTGTS